MVLMNAISDLDETDKIAKVVRIISSPLERQIDESIRIQNSEAQIILNSGSEWRGDRVPRASFQTSRVRRQ